MTQDSNITAYNITILIVTILFFIVGIVYLVNQNNKQFGIWLNEVLELAPTYGFDTDQIDELEEIFWWDFYISNLTPKEAIEQYLKNNL